MQVTRIINWIIYLIGTNFRGHLVSRKKGRHISRVFILAIWVQNYFLKELIFAKMKKKILFREFYYYFTLLIAENHQLITNQTIETASCNIGIVKDIILMPNVLCNCVIHIYIVAVNYTRAMCTIGIKFLGM